jgi:tetratricopeptide (TPR) repeat protein
MDDQPVVVIRCWWRTLLTFLSVWTPSLAVAGYAVLIQGWRPLGSSWLINLVVMAVIASFVVARLMSIITRRVFHRFWASYDLLAQQKVQEALSVMKEELAFIERHLWLERWRTVLFLNDSKYGLRELVWVNIAFAHIRGGNLDRGQAAYEQCLAINPHNEIAIDNLNFAAAFVGDPLKPGGSGLAFCHTTDRKQSKMQSNIVFIALIVLVLGGGSIIGNLAMMFMLDMSSIINPMVGDRPWYLNAVIGTLALVFLITVLTAIYRLAATQMVLFDLYRANRLAKAGRYHEAIKALGVQSAFFDEHPWVDTLRSVLLLSPTTYTYREWVLLSLADVYLDLGDTNKYIDYNRECLIQNPANGLARSRLEFCNTILGSLNKPLISIPAV